VISALLEYRYLQNALLAALLASVVCGVVGVVIIEKKWIMLSGGIAHTAYGGVGLGYLLGFEPVLGAFLFAVLAAFGIGAIRRRGGIRSDVVISLFWSLGMALGIVFIAWMPGYPPDLSSYLFGSILYVNRLELLMMAALALIVLLVFLIFYQAWKAFLFDEEFASLAGVPVAFLEYLLLLLVAMAVVILIRVVGIILVLALLTAPAATAGLFVRSLKNRILAAVGLSALFCVTGLWISYATNTASGAMIVIVSAATYLLAYAVRQISDRDRRRRQMQQEEQLQQDDPSSGCTGC
jgi:zinc transport system permease protein